VEQEEFTKERKAKEIRQSLHNKLETAEECQDIDTEWETY
jgi:hypothetical protein